jgi:hypothetical protein
MLLPARKQQEDGKTTSGKEDDIASLWRNRRHGENCDEGDQGQGGAKRVGHWAQLPSAALTHKHAGQKGPKQGAESPPHCF